MPTPACAAAQAGAACPAELARARRWEYGKKERGNADGLSLCGMLRMTAQAWQRSFRTRVASSTAARGIGSVSWEAAGGKGSAKGFGLHQTSVQGCAADDKERCVEVSHS